MVNELEERERAFKKAKMDQQHDEASRWQETEKIKDEGRRLREERENELRKREQARQPPVEDDMEAPSLGLYHRNYCLPNSDQIPRSARYYYPPQVQTVRTPGFDDPGRIGGIACRVRRDRHRVDRNII